MGAGLKRARAAAKATQPKPYRAKRFGILNHLGGIWTPETFENEAAAADYIKRWQSENPNCDLGRHTVVPVRVTVSII